MSPDNKYLNEQRLKEELFELCETYEGWIDAVEQRLNNAPEGSLIVSPSNRAIQYYRWHDKEKEYIPAGQMELVKALAQKGYDQKALAVLKRWQTREKRIKRWVEEDSLETLYLKLSPDRKSLIVPLVGSAQEFVEEWLAEEYEGLGFQENEPEFYAVDGTRVRSKSERDTVDELIEFSVPYKYEKPLQLKGFGVVHPDFCVLNRRTGQEFVWEHFGMMDDRSYAVDNIRKLEAYHYNGFFEGVNFISTWETRRTPFGRRDARRVIEQYLL